MQLNEIIADLKGRLTELKESVSLWQIAAIGVLVVLLLIGGGILYLKSQPEPVVTVKEISEKAPEPKSEPKKLMVHIAGAVVRPGVYELPEGKRVIDAVNIAGGGAGEADLDALNLAAKLIDGQKIYVPKKGEGPIQGSAPTGVGEAASNEAPLNLNTATLEQLDALPGIGPVLAQRIIDWRTEHQRFIKVEQLLEVEGIGEKKFKQIKEKVTID